MADRYTLSYTAAGLRRAETALLASAYLELGSWEAVRAAAVENDLLMIRQPASRARVTGELIKRLKNLTPAELRAVAGNATGAQPVAGNAAAAGAQPGNATGAGAQPVAGNAAAPGAQPPTDAPTADALIWVGICRTYAFVAEFTVEVAAQRWREGVRTLAPGAYEAFFDERAATHPELAGLSAQTAARLRSQLFTMYRAMGFLSAEGALVPYLLPKPARALVCPEDRAFFPTLVG